METEKMTFSRAIARALDEEMDRDSRVMVMGEDIGPQGGVFGTSRGLYEKYGCDRVMDTPISENSFVGAAVGAAMTGLRPVVEIMYIDFITLAMDQIINQAAKLRYMFGGKVKVPLVVRTQGGAGKGNAGHHSQSLEVFFCHIPGLKVVMPSNPSDARGLLKASIREDNAVVFIEHKLLYNIEGEVPLEEGIIELGKADIKRKGNDITIVAVSYMALEALEAAEELEKENINCEVIDPRTLSPLDKDMIISSVKKTGKLLIVHESAKKAGTGAYIAAEVGVDVFDYLDHPIE
ncbi:MAG: alpha-ketoacid dehydrogenase subunit beta, partial [Candidatus Humimicrobiaceae bacterium]